MWDFFLAFFGGLFLGGKIASSKVQNYRDKKTNELIKEDIISNTELYSATDAEIKAVEKAVLSNREFYRKEFNSDLVYIYGPNYTEEYGNPYIWQYWYYNEFEALTQLVLARDYKKIVMFGKKALRTGNRRQSPYSFRLFKIINSYTKDPNCELVQNPFILGDNKYGWSKCDAQMQIACMSAYSKHPESHEKYWSENCKTPPLDRLPRERVRDN